MDECKLFNKYPILETKELALHKITTRNFNDFYEICSNDNLYQYRPCNATKNQSVVYNMITMYNRDYQHKKSLTLGIFLKGTTEKLVGYIEVFDFNTSVDMVTIGYTLNEPYQGKGIATRALHLLLGFLFFEVNINRVQAYVISENTKSKNVLLHNNFIQEGTIRQGIYWSNKGVVDLDLFALLKADFFKLYYPQKVMATL